MRIRSAVVAMAVSTLIAATGACTLLTDLDGLAGPAGSTDGGDDGGARADADAASTVPDGGDAGSAYAAVVLSDGPLAYLRFGERTGVVVYDASGKGNSGDVRGNPTLGAAGAIAGDVDTAIHFPGPATGVDIGTMFAFPGRATFTLEVWARVETVDLEYRHLFIRSATPATGRDAYGVFVQNGQLSFERYVGGASNFAHTDSDPIRGRYAHVVGVYDGVLLRLFVDGVQADTALDARPQLGREAPFRVGSKTDDVGSFVGDLDEVAIYDKALTAARIKAHYDAGKGLK